MEQLIFQTWKLLFALLRAGEAWTHCLVSDRGSPHGHVWLFSLWKIFGWKCANVCAHLPTLTHTLYTLYTICPHFLSGSTLFLVPTWSLTLSPLPWSLLTPPYRLYLTPTTTYHFKNALHPSWFPICISQVISCKQKKLLCVDLSSCGIYWGTLSTQMASFRKQTGAKKGNTVRTWANSCHSSSAVRAFGAHVGTILTLKMDVTAVFLCLSGCTWLTKPQSHASIAAREAEKVSNGCIQNR